MTVQIYVVSAEGPRGFPVRRWLRSYNPDGFDGMGEIVFTDERGEAAVYEDFAAAAEHWRAVSSTHPTRYDGKPNRPLTAYSIEILAPDREPIVI